MMENNIEEVILNLTEKNIVYVGGFGGIGLETCKQLLLKGVGHLMILDKTWNESAFKELDVLDSRRACQFMEFDVTCGLEKTRQVFAAIVEKFGHIDVLINGAGICNEEDYDLIIATNLTGTVNATLVAYDLMDKSQGGRGGVVVNIASVAALSPFPVLPIYSATKGGVLNFTRALANLKPKTGITLYTICPGITNTNHWDTVQCFQGKSLCLKDRAQGQRFPSQSAVDCATNIIKIIEAHKNGSTWMCDMGQSKLVEIKNFWCPLKRSPEGEPCSKLAEQSN